MRTVAVVLAGGSGLRLGGTAPKQFQMLAGRTLLEHSVVAFERAPGIDQIVAVIAADFIADAERVLGGRYSKVTDIITGGRERQDSTRRAIDLLGQAVDRGVQAHGSDPRNRRQGVAAARTGAPPADAPQGRVPPAGAPARVTPEADGPDPGGPDPGGSGSDRPDPGGSGAGEPDCNVLFHDAARPLVDQRIIADCVASLAVCQAVGVVVPSADTIVRMADGVMTSMPPRESLGRCQTPQGFRLSVIRRAHELAGADPRAAEFSATDDCGMVLRYLPDVAVHVVPGSERNLKITYPADLRIAEVLLAGGA